MEELLNGYKGVGEGCIPGQVCKPHVSHLNFSPVEPGARQWRLHLSATAWANPHEYMGSRLIQHVKRGRQSDKPPSLAQTSPEPCELSQHFREHQNLDPQECGRRKLIREHTQ